VFVRLLSLRGSGSVATTSCQQLSTKEFCKEKCWKLSDKLWSFSGERAQLYLPISAAVFVVESEATDRALNSRSDQQPCRARCVANKREIYTYLQILYTSHNFSKEYSRLVQTTLCMVQCHASKLESFHT
jgi:hypothetical protein